jgi:hypothetical protein
VISQDGTFYHQTCNRTPAQAPACTQSGLTEGSVCTVCGVTLQTQQPLPALGHDYRYTAVDADTHAVVCTRCDENATEPHAYTDGFCICGAEEVAEPVVDETIRIYHTLDLASDISITFAVATTALQNYDSYYLECVIPEYEGNTQIGTSTVTIQPVLTGGYYYFKLTGMTALEMGDMVNATLHMSKNGVEYVSKLDTYSVATYAYNTLNQSKNEKILRLCANLLRYGAKAQIFKGYRTDSLADGAMTETEKAYVTDLDTVAFGNTNTVEKVKEAPSEISFEYLFSNSICHQCAFIKTSLMAKYKYDEKYKIVSDRKFFLQALIVDNCSYRKVPVMIVNYDITGFSANNPMMSRMEYDSVLEELFPARILSDYGRKSKGELYGPSMYDKLFLEIRGRKYRKLVYSMTVILLKVISIFKRSASFVAHFPTTLK